jgi:hypothetical protein
MGVVGIVFRNNSLGNVSMASSVVWLVLSVFGFGSVFFGQRTLVKLYSILIVLAFFASTAVSIYFMYSAEGKSNYRDIYTEFRKLNQGVTFESFSTIVIVTGWVGIGFYFLFQGCILFFLYKYYKFLGQVNKQERV